MSKFYPSNPTWLAIVSLVIFEDNRATYHLQYARHSQSHHFLPPLNHPVHRSGPVIGGLSQSQSTATNKYTRVREACSAHVEHQGCQLKDGTQQGIERDWDRSLFTRFSCDRHVLRPPAVGGKDFLQRHGRARRAPIRENAKVHPTRRTAGETILPKDQHEMH